VAGCLLAILFLASQNRVFGVFGIAERSARPCSASGVDSDGC
jgi:hypothetical protein